MIIISDSSSLILLEKSELLNKLTEKTKIIIPNKVYEEVVKEGLRKNYTDAIKINNLVKNKRVIVKKIKKLRDFPITLGEGEKEALELYYQEKARAIIVDDKKALNVCKAMNIPYITVHIVLMDMLKEKMINKQQALDSLKILDREGRYSSDIILHYYNQISEVK